MWMFYNMIKYIINPGYMISKSDGNMHYITAGMLMNLYQVKESECIIVRSEKDLYKLKGFNNTLINLYPRFDGKYK